jgi:hypothetical protein
MNSATTINPAHNPDRKSARDSMPDLTRLRYFHGQMLVADDLQTEQDYFREKLKLHARCLHGYGTVCGLKVVAVETEAECDPKTRQQAPNQQQTPQQPACARIEFGLALDCEGNELFLRHPLVIDLWHELTDAERHRIENAPDKKATLFLSLCYCAQLIDPVRPVLPNACDAVSECVYSKLRDSVRVKVTTEKPCEDHCRDNCCEKREDKCLLLAAIDFEKGRPVTDENIHNDVRRWVTLYEPVTITGVSWVHGADNYSPEEAAKMLQDQGLTIDFSRPVLPETVTPGVVDVLVFEGGKGRHAGSYFLDGDVSVHDNRRIVFKQTSDEELEDGDRVLITVRADFILDECCRPVDGNHLGGRVPLLESFADNVPGQGAPPAFTRCLQPPRRYGSWTSGNGSPGGTFESWFYIKRPQRQPRSR